MTIWRIEEGTKDEQGSRRQNFAIEVYNLENFNHKGIKETEKLESASNVTFAVEVAVAIIYFKSKIVGPI